MTIKLTQRQKDICTYLIRGKKNTEIAEILNISRHTVKAYISSLILNTKVKNRTELAYVLGKENVITV